MDNHGWHSLEEYAFLIREANFLPQHGAFDLSYKNYYFLSITYAWLSIHDHPRYIHSWHTHYADWISIYLQIQACILLITSPPWEILYTYTTYLWATHVPSTKYAFFYHFIECAPLQDKSMTCPWTIHTIILQSCMLISIQSTWVIILSRKDFRIRCKMGCIFCEICEL